MAQAALIEDALATLEGTAEAYAARLETALAVNGAILGCYASALTGTVVTLPFAGAEDQLPKLQGSAVMRSLFA